MYETAAGLGHRDSIRALCVYYVSGIRGLCSTLVVDHDNIKFLDSSENAPHGQKQVYEFLERAARLGCMESMVRSLPFFGVGVGVGDGVGVGVGGGGGGGDGDGDSALGTS